MKLPLSTTTVTDNTTEPHHTRQESRPSPYLVLVICERLCAAQIHACTVISDCAFLYNASSSAPHLPSASPSPPTTTLAQPTISASSYQQYHEIIRASPQHQRILHSVKQVAVCITKEPCLSTSLGCYPHITTGIAPEATLGGLYVRTFRLLSAQREHEDQEAGYIAA